MKRRSLVAVLAPALLVLPAVGAWWVSRRVSVDFTTAVTEARPARIRPDFSETVVPPNIAPLNFVVEESGTAYGVRIRSEVGEAIEVVGHSPKIIIPSAGGHRGYMIVRCVAAADAKLPIVLVIDGDDFLDLFLQRGP